MTIAAIPTLSLTRLSSDDFANAIGESFRSFGFAIVTDHGIDAALTARGWEEARALLALPEAVRRSYAIEGLAGQRGYTPFGREIAKGADVSDLKEFWHVGRPNVTPDNLMPENIWPMELPAFRDTFEALFAAFERTGAHILSAIASHLGLPPDWFAPAIADGNSILRLLHYPPVNDAAGAVRAGAHEDINLITLLLGAEEAGLELRLRNGDWLAIDPPPGALVVNIGDMLQRLSNHVLPSTTHRVVNPTGDRAAFSRYSMPFFLHLRPDFLIEALPSCIARGEQPREAPITAQAYLEQRLREIGLM